MALSLPHDLVFTPLDVLTAEEMNEIVENYTFIAQQFPLSADNIADASINSAKLASGGVTAAKVNYDSVFKTISQGTSLTYSVQNGSYGSVTTMDISGMPTGAQFFAIAKVTFTGSATDTGVFTRLRYNGIYGLVGQSTTAWGRSLDTYGIFTKQSSVSTMYIQAMKDNSTVVTATEVDFIAFRIG